MKIEVDIVFTSSEHQAISISKTNQLMDSNDQVGQVYLTISELSKKSRKKHELLYNLELNVLTVQKNSF